MKYTIHLTANGQEIETTASIRSDARIATTYRKIASAAAAAIRALFPDSVISYACDLPNVWTNGGFGSVYLYADDLPVDDWEGRIISFRDDGLQFTF